MYLLYVFNIFVAQCATISNILSGKKCCKINIKTKTMILFGFLAMAMLLWTLNVSFQLKQLAANMESLETEIKDAATSCGQTVN